MDAFYVSVELQRRPELRGKPVVVAGSGPRAVVTTASYEARRFGVFSATPAERARRNCPDAIFIPPDFEAYRERSREVMGVLRAHVERVEVVGLDEAYLDLTGFDRPRAAARRVKAAVTRPPASAARSGSGPTSSSPRWPRTPRSRTASSCSAPSRRASASPARRPGLLPGIGPKTAERLERQGIDTLGRARGHLRRAAGRVVRRPPRPVARPPGPLRGRSRHRDRARGQVRVARDHLRRGPARPGPARAAAAPPHRAALRDARAPGPARPHGRHQGPLRRLLDGHAGALGRRAGQRAGRRLADRARAAAPPRPAPAGAPDRRARGRARTRTPAAARAGRSAHPLAL